MGDPTPNAGTEGRRIFLSYSSSDRTRVNGLRMLLRALGHEVFIDHDSILPGRRWEAALRDGLDEADVVLVFWTKYSAQSPWVRREIEYFHVHHPERPLVPVRGDEAPLSELLSAHQHADLFPLVNELLEMQRDLTKRRVEQATIQQAILTRLREAGIEITDRNRKSLLMTFARAGSLGLFVTPLASLLWLVRTAVETYAQLSAAHVVAVAVPGLAFVVIVLMAPVAPPVVVPGPPSGLAGRWTDERVSCPWEIRLERDRISATLLEDCRGWPKGFEVGARRDSG